MLKNESLLVPATNCIRRLRLLTEIAAIVAAEHRDSGLRGWQENPMTSARPSRQAIPSRSTPDLLIGLGSMARGSGLWRPGWPPCHPRSSMLTTNSRWPKQSRR
jgi:hypothetical protein